MALSQEIVDKELFICPKCGSKKPDFKKQKTEKSEKVDGREYLIPGIEYYCDGCDWEGFFQTEETIDVWQRDWEKLKNSLFIGGILFFIFIVFRIIAFFNGESFLPN